MRIMYKTWMNEAKKPVRLYYKNGVLVAGDFKCEGTPDASIADQIFNNNNLASCSVRYTGQLKREKLNKGYVPPEFLGIQNVSDIVKEPVKDETGNIVIRKKRETISSEIMKEIIKLAELGLTLKETETKTGISYAKLTQIAKKEKLVFVKGKKGKKSIKAIDPALIENMKRCASEGKTLKESETALNVAYAKLALLARKNGITFKAGVKGKPSSGIKKQLDPELTAKVKACVTEGLTVSLTVKRLNVPWFEIVKIAKAENLTFVKGKRGRQKQ